LDEPSLGLAPLIIQRIGDVITEINRQGTSVLLVEQNATLALAVSHRAYVLDVGQVSLSGSADDLRSSDEVQKLYLGHEKGTGPAAVPEPVKTLSRWTS
jgi:branched-chain amino acid transport system ATP-binding protein